MARSPKPGPAKVRQFWLRGRWTFETQVLLVLATSASLLTFFYCFQHNQILLYGDAEGHINIARRVFDSRSPGPLQLGTVWLPLPHLLMMPFLVSDWAWRTAIGGSVPSLIAYVCAVFGIFRLTRAILGDSAKFPAWFAVLVFGCNPSLLYLQTTAMTETLYLALFIWAVVHLTEFARKVQQEDWVGARTSLRWCGLVLAATTMTRYDGWIAMALAATVVLVIFGGNRVRGISGASSLTKPVLGFLLICAAGPLLWFAYNTAVYRNPIEFANGPYSAKAIEHRIVQPPHPGTNDLAMAELYFVRAVEMNLARTVPTAKFWLILAVLGTAAGLRFRQGWLPLLLWIPLPFYALSIAYSGVPIFVPDWWPFGLYNLRYGLQLLPAVAVSSAIALHGVLKRIPNARAQQAIAAIVTGFCLWTASQAASNPASFLEAKVNMRGRVALQERLATVMAALPENSSILMALRDFPGAPQRAGVHLCRTINENDLRLWRQPQDEEGLWTRALEDPAKYSDFAIGFAGDPVDAAAAAHRLKPLLILEVSGQPKATLYRTR